MIINETMTDVGSTHLEVTLSPADIAEWIEGWRSAAVQKELRDASALPPFEELDWTNPEVQNTVRRILFEYGETEIMDMRFPSAIDIPLFSAADGVSPDQPFIFCIDYTALPKRSLKDYAPVKMTLPAIRISDADVEQQLQAVLKEAPCTQEKPDGSVVEEGDTVEISMHSIYTQTGATCDALCSARREYRLGDGFLPPAFDTAILGCRVGDTATCEMLIDKVEDPLDIEQQNEEKHYTKVTVELTVLCIMRDDASCVDDAYVRRQFPGISTVEHLKLAVRKELEADIENSLYLEKVKRVCNDLSRRIDGPIPDAVYEAYFRQAIKGFEEQLNAEGLTMKDYFEQENVSESEFKTSVMLDLRGQLLTAVALDAYADYLGIEPTAQDVTDFLVSVRAEEGEDAVRMIEEAPYYAGVIEATRRSMAQRQAVDCAVVTYYEN